MLWGGEECQKEMFPSSWYNNFPWLHFCHSSLKVFCHCCKNALKSQVSVMSARADPAFSTTGFSNWKKVVDNFREHECSLAHNLFYHTWIAIFVLGRTKHLLHALFALKLYTTRNMKMAPPTWNSFLLHCKNNSYWQKLSTLKKRRKLYQHGEKEIKLLRLRDDYSKTRSDLNNYVRVGLHFHRGSS